MVVAMLVVAGCGSGDEAETPFAVSSTVVWHETTQNISVWAPEADGSWPMVYMIHAYGGRGQDLAETATRLAEQGVLVFAPDYPSRDWDFSAKVQDLECGYRYVRSIAHEYGGDLTQPVTFVGDSWGAYMALGGGVLEAAYGPDGDYDVCFTGAPRADVIIAIGGCYYEVDGQDAWPIVEVLVDNVGTAKTDADLVLVIGENDTLCPPWQSEDATETLRSVGYDVELVIVPGGDHGNVVFWNQVDGEWVTVPDDPVGQEVVQIILDAIEAAEA
jgi:acetyl esterase/lipase